MKFETLSHTPADPDNDVPEVEISACQVGSSTLVRTVQIWRHKNGKVAAVTSDAAVIPHCHLKDGALSPIRVK